MRQNKGVFISIAIPLIVGGVSALLTKNAMEMFGRVNQPPLSPPGWLFPIVWTMLYVLMGISSYLVTDTRARQLYGYQLIVNFLWPTFFFQFQWYGFSFLWLILLWVLVLLMIQKFYGIHKFAAYMNIPYLIWLTFAGYLNLGVWWLN